MSKPGLGQKDWFWALVLVLAVIAAYSPVWWAGFIWDDDLVITANPVIVGPLGLKEIWTTAAADICPLTLTTFWCEHALWGNASLPYHIVNVALHAACAVLLWRVLLALRIPGAWLGAAFWALHPVQVESVAWISETKNTQSGLFFLLAVLFFVKDLSIENEAPRPRSKWNYPLVLLFAALAMASKSSTVILPVVLCLCAWWIERRWRWRIVLKTAPLFALAVIAALVSMSTQAYAIQDGAPWLPAWPERLATGGDAVWFYLGKLLWPHPLVPIYPRWKIDSVSWISYLPLLAVAAALFLLWRKRDSMLRPVFFAFAYYVVVLLPALGVVSMSFFRTAQVADHFQYLADIGPLSLAAAGLVRVVDFSLPACRRWRAVLAALLLFPLALLSWRQVWVFQDLKTLWTHVLLWNSRSWVAHNGLGNVLTQEGRTNDAIAQFQQALDAFPNYDMANLNLGIAFLRQGRADDAFAQIQKTIAINPNFPDAYNALGVLLFEKGDVDHAILQYRTALAIEPSDASALNNLGKALLHQGNVDEAIDQIQKALFYDPALAYAHDNLGDALERKQRLPEAAVEYQKALSIDPGFAQAHESLGLLLARSGQVAGAISEFQQALAGEPNSIEAHNNLGLSLLQAGRVDEAIAEFQKALALEPQFADAHFNLSLALAQQGKLDEALAECRKVLAIHPQFAPAYYRIGVVLVQKSQLDEAIAQFRHALEIDPHYDKAQNALAQAQLLLQQKAGHK